MSDRQQLPLEHYEKMTAEELAAVLRADLEAEENAGLDSETLLHVMQFYAHKQPNKFSKTAKEAYAEFRRDYMPQAASADNSKMHRRKTRCWRYMTTAAAVVTLVLCAGLCVRGWVVRSTQPIYRQDRDYLFVQGAYSEGTEGNVCEIAEQSFPQGIPEGYERVQTKCSSDAYSAVYYRGAPTKEDCLSVHYQAVTLGHEIRFFKNPEQAKAFTHDGVQFYLFGNTQWTCAVGSFDGIVVSINGKLTDEEMIRLVKSMDLSR